MGGQLWANSSLAEEVIVANTGRQELKVSQTIYKRSTTLKIEIIEPVLARKLKPI